MLRERSQGRQKSCNEREGEMWIRRPQPPHSKAKRQELCRSRQVDTGEEKGDRSTLQSHSPNDKELFLQEFFKTLFSSKRKQIWHLKGHHQWMLKIKNEWVFKHCGCSKIKTVSFSGQHNRSHRIYQWWKKEKNSLPMMFPIGLGAKGLFLLGTFWLYDWFVSGSGTLKRTSQEQTRIVFTICQELL